MPRPDLLSHLVLEISSKLDLLPLEVSMFDGVSFSDNTLLFHSSPSADQAGASTTLRQASLVFGSETVSIGSYGPFALPLDVRAAKEFQRLLVLNDNSIRVTGTSKQLRR